MALKEQQYQIFKAKDMRALGTRLLIILELRVLALAKRYVGSGNEIETPTPAQRGSGGRGWGQRYQDIRISLNYRYKHFE